MRLLPFLLAAAFSSVAVAYSDPEDSRHRRLGTVASLQLVSVPNGNVIKVLSNGDKVTLPSGGANIEATVTGSPTGSVVFLKNNAPVQTENVARTFFLVVANQLWARNFSLTLSFLLPFYTAYTYCSDSAGSFKSCSDLQLPVGTSTITATPYSAAGGSGTAGTPYSVTFEVLSGSTVSSGLMFEID